MGATMWPDILWAGVALAGVVGSGLTFRLAFPNEAKRLGRLLEVEILSRLPRPERKVTVEEAVLFEREVSFEWWDDEFRKLSAATDPMALEARHDWLTSRGLRQVTYGDMTFSTQAIYEAVERRWNKGGWQNRPPYLYEPKLAESCPSAPDYPDRPNPRCECEYQEQMTYADSYSQYIRTQKCFYCRLEDGPQIDEAVFEKVLA